MTNKPFSLLKPILDERATKSRRYCIVISLIALFIGLTNQVPSKILLLGLNFESADEAIIVWFIFCITAVIFIDFICHAAPNIISFIATYKAYSIYIKGDGIFKDEGSCVEQYKTLYTGMGKEISTDEYSAGRASDDPIVFENLFLHKHNVKIIFFCWIRIGIELIIPSGITVWALYELLQLI